jgi:hypothetical protein
MYPFQLLVQRTNALADAVNVSGRDLVPMHMSAPVPQGIDSSHTLDGRIRHDTQATDQAQLLGEGESRSLEPLRIGKGACNHAVESLFRKKVQP